LGSVWTVGLEVGLCGQSVHERLTRLGIIKKMNVLSDDEKIKIRLLYEWGFISGDGKMQALARDIGRTRQFISRYAKEIGLTNKHRKKHQSIRNQLSTNSKTWHSINEHPKGFSGHKHKLESLAIISSKSKNSWTAKSDEEKSTKIMKMLKTKSLKGNLHPPRHKTSWKGGWHQIGDRKIYMRSSWEYKYALLLDNRKRLGLIKDWFYEEDTFWFDAIKTGTRCYTPDFKIFNNDDSVEYHEIKGWMDNKSKTKIARMAKYHPNINLIVIDSALYKKIIKNFI